MIWRRGSESAECGTSVGERELCVWGCVCGTSDVHTHVEVT